MPPSFSNALGLNPVDLLKTKIERYAKQDPQDIDAILAAHPLSETDFFHLAKEMLIDFVGNQRTLRVTLEIIAEKHFGASAAEKIKKHGSPLSRG